MGTTADKLTYLNNTKLAIKNELNKFGADIEDNDTFRSYANALESIYNDYPTINNTGDNILLNNTKKAPFKKLELNSTELTQDGTPTSENPVDVNVIKGENNVKVENKNLFDYSKIVNLALSSTVVEATNYKGYYIPYVQGKTYTISRNTTTNEKNNRFRVCFTYDKPTNGVEFYNGEGTVGQWYSFDSDLSGTVQSNIDFKYLFIYLSNNSTSPITEEDVKIQLEQNSTATENVEHQEQNYPISLSSKNLFDYNNYTYDNTTLNAYRFIEIQNTKPNTTYTIYNYEDMSNSNFPNTFLARDNQYSGISWQYIARSDYVTIQTNATGKLYLCTYASGTWTEELWNEFISYFENAMLVEGNDTSLAYTPYFEPIEYCKIGDYADQISNEFESKNSFNINDFVTKMSIPFNATNQNGVVTITRKSDTTYNYPLNCKENTQYTISFDLKNPNTQYYIRFSYSDNTYSSIAGEISYSEFTSITATSTASKTITGINFQLYGYGNNIQMKNIQLEEGDTITEFMPYGITKGEWYLKKNIDKVVLDGSENWNYVSGTHPRFTMPKSDIALQEFNVGAPNVAISDYFKASNWYSAYSFAAVDNVICSHNSSHVINIKSTQFTSLDDFKTWLSTHNTKVYYVLTIPIYIHISQTEYPTLKTQLDNLYNNAKSYDGQTNITQTNDDLPFNINISALMKGDI